MAVGFHLEIGSIILKLGRTSEHTLMEGIIAIGIVVLVLGLIAAMLVWLCSDSGTSGRQRPTRRAQRIRARPGLKAEEVEVGRMYKLKASAALRVAPQLDSPRTGMLDPGEWFTVKALTILPAENSGTGNEVLRMCCAEGRGWVSLKAKDGTELFHACSHEKKVQDHEDHTNGSGSDREIQGDNTHDEGQDNEEEQEEEDEYEYEDDENGSNTTDEDANDSEIDTEHDSHDEYETIGRAPRHVLRYRVVASKAVIREGMEISSAEVGELVEGDIVDGWEELVTDEGHTRLRISENEWVSRLTARGNVLLQSEMER